MRCVHHHVSIALWRVFVWHQNQITFTFSRSLYSVTVRFVLRFSGDKFIVPLLKIVQTQFKRNQKPNTHTLSMTFVFMFRYELRRTFSIRSIAVTTSLRCCCLIFLNLFLMWLFVCCLLLLLFFLIFSFCNIQLTLNVMATVEKKQQHNGAAINECTMMESRICVLPRVDCFEKAEIQKFVQFRMIVWTLCLHMVRCWCERFDSKTK